MKINRLGRKINSGMIGRQHFRPYNVPQISLIVGHINRSAVAVPLLSEGPIFLKRSTAALAYVLV